MLLKKNRTEILQMGYDIKDIGTHSIRKGAATYCASGTTAAPGSIAISICGAWKMGTVHDTYFLYERAGDQYVGRVLAGLPRLSPDFAQTPPVIVCLQR